MIPVKTYGALAATLLLAACAALEPAPQPVARAAAFDIVGRVAVNYDGRAFSGNVRWEHTAERDEIWLLTPLGQALAHIVGDASGAIYTGADRKQVRARDIESLTRRALGWELPIAHLSWWVQGAIAPAAVTQKLERDGQGRLASLGQDDWLINYSHFPSDQHGGRPRRLDIAAGTQEIRLLIDGWRRDGESP
jgi:outer membrane lipoprotein LolB